MRMKLISALAAMLCTATAAHANEITLVFLNHDITLSGQFAGFRDYAYVIQTDEGTYHIPANYVTCVGEDCLVIISAEALN